uniref:Ankyrin repeat protein RF_0381 n=1 Tax=Culex pipiens TaxID=7175 RepID=A0A8D8JZZ9_CULPI
MMKRHYPKQYYDKRMELFEEFFPSYLDDIERIRTNTEAEQCNFGQQHSTETFDASPDPSSNTVESNDVPLLHQAVQIDDQHLFIQLLESGHDIDALDTAGNHSIHFVQSETMLELIVNRHPDGQRIVHRTNHEGFTLLHRVCSLRMDHKTMSDLLKRVIECGANVHQLTKNGESIAFFVENCDVLEYLREFDIQLEVVNQNGETALERHLYNENVQMARALLVRTHTSSTFKQRAHKYLNLMLKKGRYFFIRDYQDVLEKHPELTKALFDALYNHSREEASRLFAQACRNEIYFIVEKFLDFDYNLNYNFVYSEDEYDDEGTPLLRLINPRENFSNEHLIERLLQKDVDVSVRNGSGCNALLALALRYRFDNGSENGEKLLQQLMKRGASIDSVDFDGNTALHWAFLSGRLELVEVLVRNGADFRVKNNGGNIPLQMADAVNQELFYFWS